MKVPMTTQSGAYIHSGNQEKQLYADVGRDGLIVVLELNTDCHGQVVTYCMRGGIIETCMSVDECRHIGFALVELIAVAKDLWPRAMINSPAS
jgi:hypothetical protein